MSSRLRNTHSVTFTTYVHLYTISFTDRWYGFLVFTQILQNLSSRINHMNMWIRLKWAFLVIIKSKISIREAKHTPFATHSTYIISSFSFLFLLIKNIQVAEEIEGTTILTKTDCAIKFTISRFHYCFILRHSATVSSEDSIHIVHNIFQLKIDKISFRCTFKVVQNGSRDT